MELILDIVEFKELILLHVISNELKQGVGNYVQNKKILGIMIVGVTVVAGFMHYGDYNLKKISAATEEMTDGKNSSSDMEKYDEQKTDTKSKTKEIQWERDLTGDGIDERIMVYVDTVVEKNSVEIFSGKTNKLIYHTHVCPVHMHNGSVGLINRDDRYYLYSCTMTMYQGYGYYALNIIDLSDEEERPEIIEKYETGFSLDESPQEDIDRLLVFMDQVNPIFASSFKLIGCNPGLSYSEGETLKKDMCEPFEEIGTMIVNIHAREQE